MKTHIKAGLDRRPEESRRHQRSQRVPAASHAWLERGWRRLLLQASSAARDWYDAAYDRFWGVYGTLSESAAEDSAPRLLGGLWRASRMLTDDSTATGSWYGNETVWRMTLDLNHLLYFGDHAPAAGHFDRRRHRRRRRRRSAAAHVEAGRRARRRRESGLCRLRAGKTDGLQHFPSANAV